MGKQGREPTFALKCDYYPCLHRSFFSAPCSQAQPAFLSGQGEEYATWQNQSSLSAVAEGGTDWNTLPRMMNEEGEREGEGGVGSALPLTHHVPWTRSPQSPFPSNPAFGLAHI